MSKLTPLRVIEFAVTENSPLLDPRSLPPFPIAITQNGGP